jgi:pimeloyl-ACP methyl ester carboxylesterase
VLLGMRRYPRPYAAPVLLLHGLAQNLHGWDLPVPGHSLARHLSAAGFDVWLGNFRGHGRRPHRSGAGDRAARIDDYGLLDVPALVDRVRRVTGRQPLVVGHSMGGVATLMCLLGATYDGQGRVVVDPRRAEARQQAVAGAVLVAVPPGLRWDARPGLATWLRGDKWECNPLLQSVLTRRSVRGLLERLPLDVFPTGGVARAVDRAAALPGPFGLLGAAFVHVGGAAVSNALAHTLWNPHNMDRALVEAETRHTLEDASRPVLRQFVDWIAHGTMREFTTDDPKRPPLVYADHLGAVQVPVLMVAGALDRVVPPSQVVRHGLRNIGSADRSLLVLPGFGHNDLRVGVAAPTALYPRIADWLRDRAALTLADRAASTARAHDLG